ncbi:hypothetical protein DAPPUDRAFT_241459 [Daphnia pulex]|uniref:Peptidase S1 domain-containing protein n=1 Tax=Daphnia pulex TaxID=6669 RepID=E9GEA7_DAPPU|nr:hypothetical protein DAPPUDRAFT_241459 [Daphnia pulex]|eukprot:EFX82343.1 hypothetical protein DAPPUDRAFT_241459 [Daphnia pulex]
MFKQTEDCAYKQIGIVSLAPKSDSCRIGNSSAYTRSSSYSSWVNKITSPATSPSSAPVKRRPSLCYSFHSPLSP